MGDHKNEIARLKEQLAAKDQELERFKKFHTPADQLDRLLWRGGQHYKELLEATPVPVVFYDNQGAALFVNQVFTETYGYSRDDVLGKRLDFVPEDEIEPTRHAWQRTLDGENVNLITKRYTKDRRIRIIEIHTAIIRDHKGGHLASIVIHKDITGAKQAEQNQLEKEKINAAMETAGAVCHEMSQPLQVIQATLELMLMETANPGGKHQKRLQTLSEQSERLGSIVKKLNLITEFKTKQYMDETRILDLDLSADKAKQS